MIGKPRVPTDPKAFAKLLVSQTEISGGYASDLAHGNKSPSLKMAVRFEREYGIPPSFWVERA